MSIEDDGITAFKNFISQSLLFETMINSNDKSPSWDGEIIFYNSADHKKDNIEGKIPVQVKSAKRKIKRNETYSIKKSDLRNYLNGGGIIFIKPVFTTTTNYNIFIRLLLPVTIKALLENKKNTKKTISISLERMESILSFEKRCDHFLENRKHQFNHETIIDIKSLKNEDTDFIVKTLQEGSFAKSLLSEHYFVYKQVDNIIIPSNIKFQSVSIKRNSRVCINDKVYFDHTEDSDGSSYIEFNSVLKIKLADGGILIQANFNGDSFYIDCLNAFRFFSDLLISKTFDIDGIKLSNVSFDVDSSFIADLELYENALLFFKKFRINYESLSLNKFHQNENLILKLLYTFNKDSLFQFENKYDIFLQKFDLFDTTRLILFKKIDRIHYKAYDFILDNIFTSEFILKRQNDEVEIPCSRFIALVKPVFIKAIDGYFKEVTEDLIEYYDPRVASNYSSFMLDCIKIYDETKNKDFLVLADTVNNLIFKNENNSREKDILLINKYQILKRERFLTGDGKKSLLGIEKKWPDDIDITCCIYILLDYYEKVEDAFENQSDKISQDFKDWPICNLYFQRKNINSLTLENYNENQ